jgi:hypothetical protein
VANASDAPVQCRLELDLDDHPVDVIPLELKPGQAWRESFEKTSEEGGRLLARLDRQDALAVDNLARAFLPRRERQRVLLVTDGNLFLQKALEANQFIDLAVTNSAPAQYDENAIVVFHRKSPERLPAGKVLVVDPTNSTDAWELGEQLLNPIVTEQDKDSMLMRHVRLDNVIMPEARRLEFADKPQVLVEALGGSPLYCALDRPGGKLLVLTVNLDKGDLTFRTAFPILLTNALAWFAGQESELQEAIASGSLAQITLPENEAGSEPLECVLRTPGGEDRPLPGGVTQTTVGPLDQCGVWSVVRKAEGEADRGEGPADSRPGRPQETRARAPVLELACNLANRAESDLRMPETLLNQTPTAELAAGWLTRPVWFYLIAVAWLLAAVEWFLYQRRWIS